MKFIKFLPVIICILISCKTQNDPQRSRDVNSNQIIGGGCDGCEFMYVDMPEFIDHIGTSFGWQKTNSQNLLVNGNVYNNDGKTPAENIIIYYWHTDDEGLYTAKGVKNNHNHGDLRGWVKTDKKGQFQIYTSRPKPYPNDVLPAHIHLSIKEPNLPNEYYAEDIVFDDDPLLNDYLKRYPPANRCGSGIVRTTLIKNIQTVHHNITLGLNIPNYPSSKN